MVSHFSLSLFFFCMIGGTLTIQYTDLMGAMPLQQNPNHRQVVDEDESEDESNGDKSADREEMGI
jgi:hypothetical protein